MAKQGATAFSLVGRLGVKAVVPFDTQNMLLCALLMTHPTKVVVDSWTLVPSLGGFVSVLCVFFVIKALL